MSEGLRVREVMSHKITQVQETDPIYEVAKKVAEDKETMVACVVDKQGRLKGVISPSNLLRAVEVREFGHCRYPFYDTQTCWGLLTSKYAQDIMEAPLSVTENDTVDTAINIMLDRDYYEVPVVDKQGKVIGEINYFDIISSAMERLRS